MFTVINSFIFSSLSLLVGAFSLIFSGNFKLSLYFSWIWFNFYYKLFLLKLDLKFYASILLLTGDEIEIFGLYASYLFSLSNNGAFRLIYTFFYFSKLLLIFSSFIKIFLLILVSLKT